MQTTKLLKILVLSCLYFVAYNTAKADETSTDSSITIVNQYIFRGFQSSQENPAIQADFMVNLKTGFWVGIWGSNYDFGNDDGIEIDLIAGYDFSINEDISLGFGLSEYTYSGDSSSSTEYFLSLSYAQFSLNYYDDVDLKNNYLSLDAEFELQEKLSLQLHTANNKPDNSSDHTVFSIGVNFNYSEELSLFATAFKNNAINTEDKNNFVFGATYSF